METSSVLGRLAREIVGQTGRGVLVHRELRLRRLRTLRVVHLGSAEVAVVGTLDADVVEHALVVHTLRVAAPERIIRSKQY